MFDINNYNYNDNWTGTNPEIKEFDYNSFYRAYVESTEDPEHLGRIKIRIPYLHMDSDVSTLPYAYPAIHAGLGNQTGQFLLPPVGSIVFVTFEYSDEHRPIYFGGIPTIYSENSREQYYGMRVNKGQPRKPSEDDIPSEFVDGQYIIYKSPSGSIIYIDDTDLQPQVIVKDSIGQELRFVSNDIKNTEADGAIYLKHDKDNYIKVGKDDVVIRVSGKDYHVPWSGEGGTSDYKLLINKPKLNTTNTNALTPVEEEINGTVQLHKISKTGDYQDLRNKPNIPTKTSQLQNDSNFATTDDIPTKVSELTNDSKFITKGEIPKDLSYYNNDEGFITIDVVPTKVSQLTNDSKFITENDIPTNVSEFNNDVGYLVSSDLPTKVSELQNDANYITLNDVPKQEQSDWNEDNPAKPSYIKNKPAMNIFEQKVNKVDISSSSTKDQYPNAKSVYDFVTDAIASIPQGLSIPISITDESQLPTTANDGDYYFIQDMTTTAPGHTGRAWWNNGQWYKIYDQYQSMDGVSIVQTGSGTWEVSTTWLNNVLPKQVQPDWNQTDSTKEDFIKNKPDLSNVGKQSDWNQTDNTAVDYIKNKPDLSNVGKQSDWNQTDSTKADFIKNKPDLDNLGYVKDSDLKQPDWNQTDINSKDFIKNKPDLSSYAKSTDIKQPDWNQTDNTETDYIKNKPDLSNLGVQSDWNTTDTTDKSFIKNKPDLSVYAKGTEIKQPDWNQTDTSSNDYIKNKPDLSDLGKQSDWNQNNNTKADYIKNKPSFKTINGNVITGSGDVQVGTITSSDDSVEDVITVTREQFEQLISSGQIDEKRLYNVLDTKVPEFGISSSIPVGCGTVWFGKEDAIPTHYVVADGSTLLIEEYQDLFKAYGTLYGGDGESTFGVPNLKGRIVVQQNKSDTQFDTVGETGGSKYMQGHTHTTVQVDGVPIRLDNGNGEQGYVIPFNAKGGSRSLYASTSTNVPTSDQGNLQPYIVANYIIKARQGVYTENLLNLDEEYKQLKQTVEQLVTRLDNEHPIGSLYISVNNTNPSTLYGGTWEQIEDTFLLACGTNYQAGTTGGESEHKLTIQEIPTHNHTMKITNDDSSVDVDYAYPMYDYGKTNVWGNAFSQASGYASTRVQTHINNTGGNQSHNNMPPYLAVYVWKRIS